MSTKTKHTPPTIELLKPSELTVEKDFNPRETQAFKNNVKEIAASIKARGFIDPSSHVVQYIERDGKKLVRGGHTILEAAKSLNLKEVPACRTELDSITEQVNLITSNTGHPLSYYEQGTVYVRLRDGQLAPGVKWTEGGKVRSAAMKIEREPTDEDWYRKPINQSAIAEAIGISKESVSQCIIVRECDEQISQKLIEGKISAEGVLTALRGVHAVDKQVRIINAAISAAKEEGKEKATKQHVVAVKEQFLEKKQVAAPVTTTTETTSANKDTVKETKTSRPQAEAEPESPAPELFKDGDETPQVGVGGEADETEPDPITPEMRALFDGKIPEGKEDLVKRYIAVITAFCELPETAGTLSDESIEVLSVACVKMLETPI